jgi:DNA replication protein DnaC
MTNSQYEYVVQQARERNIDLDTCPTCRQHREEIGPGVWVWEESTYRLYGETLPCGCESQDALRRHYLLAGIPKSYWTLGVDDFWGDPVALEATQDYLSNWVDHKWIGMGMEFYSPRMGVGKTMLATIIAKSLIIGGEKVYFTSFRDAVRLYDLPYEAREAKVARLRNTPVLILDEVGLSMSDAQRAYYATELEDLIRFRTSGSSVTIMTTNLTPDQLNDEYPRCFSLLEAKQCRVCVNGSDARVDGAKKMVDIELIRNHEARPLC